MWCADESLGVPGAVPQGLRGMPAYAGQQQQQQTARGVANRLPNGKMGKEDICLVAIWGIHGALGGHAD